jgi:cyanophycinase
MHARRQVGLSILILLMGHLVLGQFSREEAVQAQLQKSMSGTIVLGGGYFDPDNLNALLKRVAELAGGTSASFVVIPTADSHLEPTTKTGPSTTLVDYEKNARLTFARLGVTQLTVLHTRSRKVADSEGFAEPLRAAKCVWIPGGDSSLLSAVFPNTRVQQELQGVLNRGGVIAGDSAGAAAIGQGLLAIHLDHPEKMPEVVEKGLRLLGNVFVMVHVNRYKPGVVELGSKAFVSAHPEVQVILIEENTAVMIQAEQASRLIGTGKIGVAGGDTDGMASVLWLSGSRRYDLRRRVLVQ